MTKLFRLIARGVFFAGLGLTVAQTQAEQLPPRAEEISKSPAQVQTVIAQGIGKDVESAAKNAAENALIQVVGSFVQSDKTLTKRSEISEGIRRESRLIDAKTREYSQGSIKSFDVLETSQNDGLFRMSARVEVRIQDFRAFVQKIAEGETQVDAGVFAGLAANENNRKDLTQIVAESVVLPILNGTAINITVGKPELFENWERSPQTAEIIKSSRININTIANSTIVIPVRTEINPDFLNNASATLNNVSSSVIDAQNQDIRLGGNFTRAYDPNRDGAILMYNSSGVSPVYVFKNMFINRNNGIEKTLEDCVVKYALSPRNVSTFYFAIGQHSQCQTPNLKVTFSDESHEIYATYINPVQDDNNWYRGRSNDGKLQLLQRWRNIGSSSSPLLVLIPRRDFFIFAALSPDEVRQIKKMTVSIR